MDENSSSVLSKPMTTITDRIDMAATRSSNFLLTARVLLFFSYLLTHATTHYAATRGFTVELFQHSPPSTYNTKKSFTATTQLGGRLKVGDVGDRHQNSSLSRLRNFSNASSTLQELHRRIQSNVQVAGGLYSMKLAIGTPPVELVAALDTGSDLIWCQCEPCKNCYQQSMPIFDSRHSSTYKCEGRDSDLCKALDERERVYDDDDDDPQSSSGSNRCKYSYVYADGSFSKGVISSETLTFDTVSEGGTQEKVAIRNVGFGCGHTNQRKSGLNDLGGVIGLGRGPLSLISQLGPDYGYRFSYCLAWSTSKLKFGDDARFSLQNEAAILQRTPLLPPPSHLVPQWYYLNLKDISVNNRRLQIPTQQLTLDGRNTDGVFIMDSGTTLTELTPDIYVLFESALKDAMAHLKEIVPPHNQYSLCYSIDESTDFDQGMPTVTFHFDGGADWPLSLQNMFTMGTQGENILCSVFVPSKHKGISVFGNLAQLDFHVEYDLMNNVLSFAPTDCSRG